jgi:hypothetical protein
MPFPLPTNWEQDLAWILPDLLWAKAKFNDDPLFKHFPLTYIDAAEVHYDQYTNLGGLMPTRALGTSPDVVPMPPLNVYKVQPGHYGLSALLEEEEMTVERQPNTINKPLEVPDRLGVMAMNCATLAVNRLYQTIGTFAVSGTIANRNTAGQIVHQMITPNFQVLTPTGSGGTGPSWAGNPASATPISDLIYWQTNLLDPGTSADFGVESALLCNPKTVATFWNTQQVQKTFVSDYGASYKRGEVSPPKIDGKNSVNELLTGSGLPKLQVYKGGYYATAAAALTQDPTQFTYAIPDNKLVWIGKRPDNQPVAAMKLTRHAGISAYQADKFPTVTVENESWMELAKGVFVIADYHKMMPQHYEIQMGFNMAPFIGYFRGIAGLNVS